VNARGKAKGCLFFKHPIFEAYVKGLSKELQFLNPKPKELQFLNPKPKKQQFLNPKP
jgi:hypothetical protein